MRALEDAFIFAAGNGRRLAPLTESYPKPLLPFFGKPLLGLILDQLLHFGIRKIGVNTRHLFPQFFDYFGIEYPPKSCHRGYFHPGKNDQIPISSATKTRYHGAELELFHEWHNLETAGGLLNALQTTESSIFLKKNPFLLHHGDILSLHTAHLQELHQFHEKHRPLMSLLLIPEEQSPDEATISYDPITDQILDFRGLRQSKKSLSLPPSTLKMTYSGIAIAEPRFLSLITPRDEIAPISLIEPWLAALAQGETILGFLPSQKRYWNNVGTPSSYLDAHLKTTPIERKLLGLSKEATSTLPPHDHSITIDPTAKIGPGVIIGSGSTIGPNITLTNTLLLPDTKITLPTTIDRAILFRENQILQA